MNSIRNLLVIIGALYYCCMMSWTHASTHHFIHKTGEHVLLFSDSESMGTRVTAGGVTLTVEPESNEWWVQLKVTPRANKVEIKWDGHHVTATRASWDSTHQFFTGKPTAPIAKGQTVKAIVTKANGERVSMSFPFSWQGSSSGSQSSLPGADSSKPIHHGRATWYDARAAGTPVCRFETKYCGAPSDRVKGLGTIGPCGKGGGTCQNCERGYCNSPGCTAPQCDKGSCGRKVKIWCIDQTCKTKQPIVMTINSMCPSRHPCNTCKGDRNPCARENHFDLCEATFFAIAHSQPSWEGLKIAYQAV